MLILSAPFALAALLVYLGALPLVAIGVGWIVFMAVMYGLTSSGGVIGEE